MKSKEYYKELQAKSVADLREMLAEKQEAARELRFKISQNQEKNVRAIRKTKQEIAQILTLLHTKESAAPAQEVKDGGQAATVSK